jgi:DNA adenine methylase
VAVSAPTRPVLRWHGGKWRLAPWIISYFPEHRIYVEPFGGAGSVLLRKERSYAEVYNDLDEEVVNLFRVLRDEAQAARLIELLRLTPFARPEFEASYDPTDDQVERARRLIIRSYMGFGSNAHACVASGASSTGFRSDSNRSGTTPSHDWAKYPEALRLIVRRLAGVVIERWPARKLLERYGSRGDVLLYLDPPYLPETRSTSHVRGGGMRGHYTHELSEAAHRELLAYIQALTAMVVLSGYPSALYDDALKDWRRVETKALADGARERTEVLWINPAAAAALDRVKGGHDSPLFAKTGAAA